MRIHRTLASASVLAVSILLAGSLLIGCGNGRGPNQARTSANDVAKRSVALLSTETGVTAVEAGTTRVRWSEDGAVSALDGSAVFTRGSGALVRLDPSTGETIGTWPIDATLNPIVVAPDGRWVALTDRNVYDPAGSSWATTRLAVWDAQSGAVVAQLDLDGDVEPEAFSVDGAQLIVLDHHRVGYRVQSLVIGTGERYDTSDEDKNPIGDMTGHRVRGVLSEDRSLLATLYQNPDDPEIPAFVHVLDLSGFAYCVNLPAAFGQSADGDVLIERAAEDVIVISEHADQRAQFSLRELRDRGSRGLHLDVTSGAGERADAAYVDLPGYRGLIAIL
jgi:hypothetical protein